jgi:hypothetical protein
VAAPPKTARARISSASSAAVSGLRTARQSSALTIVVVLPLPATASTTACRLPPKSTL